MTSYDAKIMTTRTRTRTRTPRGNFSSNSFGMLVVAAAVAAAGFVLVTVEALEMVGGNLCDTSDFGSLVQEIVQSRDATIFEGQAKIASGENEFMVGTTKNGIRRGLLAFDFAPNDFPSDAKVECAEIRLRVSRNQQNNNDNNNDAQTQTQAVAPEIKLHRITKNWETSGSHRIIGVNGGTASNGDVTWGYAKYPITLWDTAGGDFDDKVVATKTEAGPVHSWGNTLSMTRLVQEWIEVGGSGSGASTGTAAAPFNAGFMLVGEENDESEKYVHYNGIENAPDLIPRLIVTYTSPSQGKEHREYTDYATEDGDGAAKRKTENNAAVADLLFFLAGTMFCGLVVIFVICVRNRKRNKSEEPELDPAIPGDNAAVLDPAEEDIPASRGEIA